VYGFAATAAIGLTASWIDRKITARLQYRVGPPFLQPTLDIIKLMGKETLVPAGASRAVFLLAPAIGFGGTVTAAALLWMNSMTPDQSFLGDVLVVLYLLLIPSLSIMLGGFSSGNPLARVGASREMKLLLGYELPFLLAMLVPVIQSEFSLKLGDILGYQAREGAFALSFSGGLALLASVLCMQAKLTLVPFDIPEAETEIMSGPFIEYSGAPLALYRLMRNMLLFTIPFFLVILFLGGFHLRGVQILYSFLKYIAFVLVITVIRNTNPRLRIDQAMRFFWGPVTLIAAAAVVLALAGY
jgi:NADH-quinone oxidoreductase subunit H